MTNHFFSNRKAQSLLISHSLAIAMSVLLVIAVIVTFSNIRSQYQKFIGENEVKQVCLSLEGAVESMYAPENYTLQTNSTMARIEMKLPEKIADEKYYARFFNNSVFVRIDKLRMNQTCKIGFSSRFNGSSDGGLTYIIWKRYTNGSDEISMGPV